MASVFVDIVRRNHNVFCKGDRVTSRFTKTEMICGEEDCCVETPRSVDSIQLLHISDCWAEVGPTEEPVHISTRPRCTEIWFRIRDTAASCAGQRMFVQET
jgi:hypothetical protein